MDAKTILSLWEKTLSEKVDYLSEHLADELVIDFLEMTVLRKPKTNILHGVFQMKVPLSETSM